MTGMSVGHSHSHSHASDPAGGSAPGDFRRRLLLVFLLTLCIVIAQAAGAWWTGSLALLTDTAHALVDASGLLLALIAGSLMLKPATTNRTWGYRRIEVIAALVQAAVLAVVGIYTAVEGVRRLFLPPEVPGTELLVFGVIGLVANVLGIVILASSRDGNFNMRAAFLEVLNDALGSFGVIVAAVIIEFTGFYRADALAGLFIAALILPRAVKLLRETTAVLMEYAPEGLDLAEVRQHLIEVDHVKDVHDLHASTVATGLPVLSAHIVVEESCFHDGHALDILQGVRQCVADHFEVSVQHSTFQLETEEVRHFAPEKHA